jgi:hypothetical protein
VIVVKVELWSAVTRKVTELGRMTIANDGRRSLADPARGDYSVEVCKRGTTSGPSARTAEVKDYPRRSYSIWRLVARALLGAFPEERPKGKPKGVRTVLDESVMRGLRLIATAAAIENAGVANGSETHGDIMAAQAWLSHGDAEDQS